METGHADDLSSGEFSAHGKRYREYLKSYAAQFALSAHGVEQQPATPIEVEAVNSGPVEVAVTSAQPVDAGEVPVPPAQ